MKENAFFISEYIILIIFFISSLHPIYSKIKYFKFNKNSLVICYRFFMKLIKIEEIDNFKIDDIKKTHNNYVTCPS